MDSLTARANTGAGTDVLAGFVTPDGFAGAAVLISSAGLDLAAVDMPLQDNPALPVRVSPQKYTDISFSQVGAGLISPEMTQIRAGAGMTVSQSAGNLVVLSGVTVNAEFVARSVNSFNGALAFKSVTTLSQRIVNNNFFLELVDVIGDGLAYTIINTTTVDVTKAVHGFTAQNVGQRMDLCALSSVGVPMEGVIASIPDANTIRFTVAGWPASGSGTLSLTGWNKIELNYTGTGATSVNFNTRRRGWQNTAVAAPTLTTASAVMACVGVEGGIVSLSDKLVTSAGVLANRASWDTNIPLPDENLFIQIRARNGTVAPATTTTWTLGMLRVEDFIAQQVSLVSTRQQSAQNALPITGSVALTGTPSVSLASTTIASGTISPLTVAGASALASAARTASGVSGVLTNASGCGGVFFVNVTAVAGTGPTLAVRLQVQDPVSLAFVDIPGAVTATITAAGLYMLTVAPGLTAVANSLVNFALPRTYQIAWAIGGSAGQSFTFSVGMAPVI
jgi:hypothetical protein